MRGGRRLVIACVVVIGLAIVIRAVLDPIATHYTRRALHDANGIDGELQRVHVTIFPPGYEVRGLKIVQSPGGDWDHPLFYAERVAVHVDWRRLFRAQLAASVRVDDGKIIIEKRAPPAPKAEQKKTEIPDVRAALEQITPARVNRIEVRNGEFLYRDLTAPHHPEIWVHRIEAAAENLTTRAKLAHGQPATLAASAKLGRSGDVTLFVSAAPFARQLDFAGNMTLRGWKVAELYALEEPATGLQTPKGTLDVFAEFKARDGAISGGVKPVLKNVEVRPTKSTVGNRLKAWLADKALRIFSDRVPDRNAVATVVPIEGRLDQPDVQLWPSVLGVVRNAFVEGISSGFAHLPPSVANDKQPAVEQTVKALKKKNGPPKAQPGNAKGKS